MKKTSGALWLRLLCLALCLVTLLSLAACGGAKKQPEAPAEPVEEVEATPEPTPEPTPAPTPTVESLAIYYMGEPIKDNDCTMRVGEALPLSIVATPGGIAGEVIWSVDPVCEDSFELTVSESDPYRATLKGVSVLPDDAGGAKISATLYGATATIVVHVLPGEGGITSVYKPSEDQTLEIRRARGDYHVDSITISPDGHFDIDKEIEGDSVGDVLSYVEYDAKELITFFRSVAERAVRRKMITPAQRKTITNAFEDGIRGYTYFER